MQKTRYAVVGAGWISQIAFLPAIPQTGNSVVTAIVSGNSEGVSKLADFHSIEHVFGYEQYEEMLAADIVDAVYIALPNSLHAEYTIRAAKAGKHVLVEKPLATTVADCEAMIAACDKAGVKLMTAYRLHNEPGTADMLEKIRAGVIGEARVFSSVFTQQADPDNHRLKAEHWGGPLQDIGVYCLNAARHVFEAEPTEVAALHGRGDNDPRFAEVEETIAVTLRFPGERIAQFVASFGGDEVDLLHVVGTKGVLSLDPAYGFQVDTKLTHRVAGKMQPEQTREPCDHFGAQASYFSDCIARDIRPESDGEEGLADVRAMLAIEKAAQTGVPQKITTTDSTRHKRPGAETARACARTDRRLLL